MKKKTNGRLISKMIAGTLIGVGITAIGAGASLGHSAMITDKETYTTSNQYTIGMTALTLGATSLSLGFATYPYDQENKNEDENQNTL